MSSAILGVLLTSSIACTGPVIESFSVAPETLPAGSLQATVEWKVTNADRISISPGVGPVDLEGRLGIEVVRDTEFVLRACSGDECVESLAKVNLERVSISGTVWGRAAPLPSVRVGVAGASAMTDEDGEFLVNGVTSPYDAIVEDPAAGFVRTAFLGLRQTNPQLLIEGAPTGIRRTGSVSGSVSNLLTGCLDCALTVAVVSNCIDPSVVPDSSGSFGFAAKWFGDSSCEFRVLAAQVQVDSAGRPLQYLRTGSSELLAIEDGGSTVAQVSLDDASAAGCTLDVLGAEATIIQLEVGESGGGATLLGPALAYADGEGIPLPDFGPELSVMISSITAKGDVDVRSSHVSPSGGLCTLDARMGNGLVSAGTSSSLSWDLSGVGVCALSVAVDSTSAIDVYTAGSELSWNALTRLGVPSERGSRATVFGGCYVEGSMDEAFGAEGFSWRSRTHSPTTSVLMGPLEWVRP